MPKVGPHNRRIVALLHDGQCSFEFGIVAEVFGLERPELGVAWYEMTTCAETPGPLRTNGHVSLIPAAGLEALDGAGTIVIPGWPSDATPSAALREALVAAHAGGARLVTICSGVFLLAALGLLEGRSVTTHWRYVDKLRELHPGLSIEPDVLYVDEGDVLTSAGSAAGIDLLLHIVRQDYGPKIANQVARRMVVPAHREGGQAQFVERPMPSRPNGRLAPLLDAIRQSPGSDWTIRRMAAEAAMSERTFIRRFNEAIGCSPGEWLIAVRTDAARDLLEGGLRNLEEVAALAGFGSVATLRHHFRNRVGVSPATYRARFSEAAEAA